MIMIHRCPNCGGVSVRDERNFGRCFNEREAAEFAAGIVKQYPLPLHTVQILDLIALPTSRPN